MVKTTTIGCWECDFEYIAVVNEDNECPNCGHVEFVDDFDGE